MRKFPQKRRLQTLHFQCVTDGKAQDFQKKGCSSHTDEKRCANVNTTKTVLAAQGCRMSTCTSVCSTMSVAKSSRNRTSRISLSHYKQDMRENYDTTNRD